jgi:phage regulator Rha-like protein
VILKRGANVKYPPLAFTEHGAIMAAAVLNSERAVQMSIFVVRAFLKLREWVADQSALATKLAALERRVGEHRGHRLARFATGGNPQGFPPFCVPYSGSGYMSLRDEIGPQRLAP